MNANTYCVYGLGDNIIKIAVFDAIPIKILPGFFLHKLTS